MALEVSPEVAKATKMIEELEKKWGNLEKYAQAMENTFEAKLKKAMSDSSAYNKELHQQLTGSEGQIKILSARIAAIGKQLEELKKDSVSPADLKAVALRVAALEKKK